MAATGAGRGPGIRRTGAKAGAPMKPRHLGPVDTPGSSHIHGTSTGHVSERHTPQSRRTLGRRSAGR